MNRNELIKQFTDYCDLLVKNNRPVMPLGASGIAKIKHLQQITHVASSLQKLMTDKANQLLSTYEHGDDDSLIKQLKEIATCKIKAFINPA